MKTFRFITVLLIASMFQGCIVWSSSPVAVNNLAKEVKGSKVVTFVSPTPYIADFTAALAEHGFTVRPMPTQQEIIEFQRAKNRIVTFNEATARYGLTLQARQSGVCAFTEFGIYNFTLMLTDITNNQVVMVLKQKGSDGPCSTVEPVWGTLAKALSENW